MPSSATTSNAASCRRPRNSNACSNSRPFRPIVLGLVGLLGVIGGGSTWAAKGPSPRTRPEVTITERDHGQIEEYRIGGRVYMIRIKPKKGHPYYLIDSNGDGLFDRYRPEVDEDLYIPAWTLLRWR